MGAGRERRGEERKKREARRDPGERQRRERGPAGERKTKENLVHEILKKLCTSLVNAPFIVKSEL